MISKQLNEEVKRVLGLWMEQYSIDGDADREARPEIIATRALLKTLDQEEVKIGYQIQISTTNGADWVNSILAPFESLEDARRQMSEAPVTTFLRYAIQPVILDGWQALRYGDETIDAMISLSKRLGYEPSWTTGKSMELKTMVPIAEHRQKIEDWLLDNGFFAVTNREYYHSAKKILVDAQYSHRIVTKIDYDMEVRT